MTIRKAILKGFITAIRIGDCKKSHYRISRKSIDAIHQDIIKEMSEKAKKKE